MDKKIKYYTTQDGEFVIENYNLAGSFSNFLPGIAGFFGIPMWVFYVNRGQGVCSFGVKSKDSPIMEFLPANRAYQLTSLQGFRTFLKIKNKKSVIFYEPFQAHSAYKFPSITQKMLVSSHQLRIQEINPEMGLEIEVVYFTIPNENFAGLARIVEVKNISKKDHSIEILDGAPIIVPYGTSNFFLQKMRRTIEAWMLVENLENNAPFYRLKVDPKDVSEVVFVKEGNFYLSGFGDKKALPIIVDPEAVFGQVNDFSYPVNFVKPGKFSMPKNQMHQNKLPSAMSFSSLNLKRKENIKIYSLIGHMESKEMLNALIPRLSEDKFFITKMAENKDIIHNLQDNVFNASNDKHYDLYIRQTFLDNVMRGGMPVTYGSQHTHPFYVYSRKHGDLERDYNRFYIEPAYFSQGDGNYRDISQNRRNDVFFKPEIRDFNILYFYNLQQLDGYNPLVMKGLKFHIREKGHLKDILRGKIADSGLEKIEAVLCGSFTPGRLLMDMERLGITLEAPPYEFLEAILKNSNTIYDAEHGEGFWIDHWTYNLDLVESFLSVYPDRLKDILLDKKEFTFYDNIFSVKPRSQRYILIKENMVRQYHSLERDAKKEHLIKSRECFPHVVRSKNGEGEVYKTTLLVKMLCIVLNKISSFDPFGIGIEMEADKPGWCDSMNGLPGLFGSSTPEVFELKKQIVFILSSFDKMRLDNDFRFIMPEEICDFLRNIEVLLKECAGDSAKKDFYCWDRSNLFKEEYREKVKFGLSGIERGISCGELREILDIFISKVERSVKKAYSPADKIYSTYFINEVSKYELLGSLDSVKGLPLVKPAAFKSSRLPLFLEGPVRAMKIEPNIKGAKQLYSSLKKTKLFDKKLKMYKINEPLGDVTKEIGRSSIFTPGWLENESIWLHMEYKYLLEILKSGLYEEFFEEFNNVLIPFQKPERYARSIFENSSFIVSSAFPNKDMHGRGFVARLSGSTAEMLNIWLLMNAGKNPFFLNDKGELNLRFSPILPAWLFTKKSDDNFPKNTYTFKFLGHTIITYHNPKMKNTAGKNSVKVNSISIEYNDGKKVDIQGDALALPYSKDVRERKVKRMDVYLV